MWLIRYKKDCFNIFYNKKKGFEKRKENNKNIEYIKGFLYEMWNNLMIWDIEDFLVFIKVVWYNVYGFVNYLYDVKVSYCWYIIIWVWKNVRML